MQTPSTLLTALVSAALLASSPALAKDKKDKKANNPNPYAKADDSWISISGTAVSPTADTFYLDYGDGTILVEVDDWDSYGEAAPLLDGDDVTVYGYIDDDFYEMSKIEASSVYVEPLNTYLYANSIDEEDFFWTLSTPVAGTHTHVRGTVSSVDKADRQFTVDTGERELTIEVDELGYNPLDDKGYQQIDPGDVVSVSGKLDRRLFEGRVLDASLVRTLWDSQNRG